MTANPGRATGERDGGPGGRGSGGRAEREEGDQPGARRERSPTVRRGGRRAAATGPQPRRCCDKGRDGDRPGQPHTEKSPERNAGAPGAGVGPRSGPPRSPAILQDRPGARCLEGGRLRPSQGLQAAQEAFPDWEAHPPGPRRHGPIGTARGPFWAL